MNKLHLLLAAGLITSSLTTLAMDKPADQNPVVPVSEKTETTNTKEYPDGTAITATDKSGTEVTITKPFATRVKENATAAADTVKDYAGKTFNFGERVVTGRDAQNYFFKEDTLKKDIILGVTFGNLLSAASTVLIVTAAYKLYKKYIANKEVTEEVEFRIDDNTSSYNTSL